MAFPRAPPRAHRATEDDAVRGVADRTQRAAHDAAEPDSGRRRHRIRRNRRSSQTSSSRRQRRRAHAPEPADADTGANAGTPLEYPGAAPATCELCSKHGLNHTGRGPGHERKEYNRLILSPGPETPHGKAGEFVQYLGTCSYVFFFAVPLLFVAIFFAIIPLGDPTNAKIGSQAVFLFCSHLAVMALYTFLYTSTFLSFARRERPFRISLIPILAVLVVQMAIFTPILLVHGTFDYLGIVALAVFYITLYAALSFSYRNLLSDLSKFFRRFILLVALYIPILVAYVIAYRESGPGLQAFLVICIAFITFVYRRVMLSRLDPFPLHLAQLIAGYVAI